MANLVTAYIKPALFFGSQRFEEEDMRCDDSAMVYQFVNDDWLSDCVDEAPRNDELKSLTFEADGFTDRDGVDLKGRKFTRMDSEADGSVILYEAETNQKCRIKIDLGTFKQRPNKKRKSHDHDQPPTAKRVATTPITSKSIFMVKARVQILSFCPHNPTILPAFMDFCKTNEPEMAERCYFDTLEADFASFVKQPEPLLPYDACIILAEYGQQLKDEDGANATLSRLMDDLVQPGLIREGKAVYHSWTTRHPVIIVWVGRTWDVENIDTEYNLHHDKYQVLQYGCDNGADSRISS